MPSFTQGGGFYTPFGKNQFLRSTRDLKVDSATLAAATVPAVTIDGWPDQKILQPGTVLAKITSGVDAGKVGPYSVDTVGVTDGRSDTANIVGINRTFVPWQLIERDVEVGVVYEAAVVQGWCLEQQADGTFAPLSDATAATMTAKKNLDIRFR